MSTCRPGRCARRLLITLSVVLAAGPLAAEPAADKLHEDNIQVFAMVAAIAQSASDRCADIKINVPVLQAIKGGIGYDPDRDGIALRAAVQSNLASIATAITAAPSLQAWCDIAYGQFGPGGTVTPGLMLR